MSETLRPAVIALSDIVQALHASGSFDDFRHTETRRFRLWIGLYHSTLPLHFLDIEMRGARALSDSRRGELVNLATQIMTDLGFTHIGAANRSYRETLIWCPTSPDLPADPNHKRIARQRLIRDTLIRNGVPYNQDDRTDPGLSFVKP